MSEANYVATGSGTLLYSKNGKNWYNTLAGGFEPGSGSGIAYSPVQDLWVAVGSDSRDERGEGEVGGVNNGVTSILYSKNGKNWYNTLAGGFEPGSGNGIAYSPVQDLWVAVGSSQTSAGSILHSKNGKKWYNALETVATIDESYSSFFGFEGGSGYDVAYSPVQDLWVAVGSSPTSAGSILHSKNGKNWHNALEGGFEGIAGYGVAYSPVQDLWVAVGNSPTSAGSILHSKDGKNWHNALEGGFEGIAGYGVAYSQVQDLWVAAGNSPTSAGSILYSKDGKKWHNALEGGFEVVVGGAVGGVFPIYQGTAVACKPGLLYKPKSTH